MLQDMHTKKAEKILLLEKGQITQEQKWTS
jgi:hypothetical protein